jgi:hypothetical protein
VWVPLALLAAPPLPPLFAPPFFPFPPFDAPSAVDIVFVVDVLMKKKIEKKSLFIGCAGAWPCVTTNQIARFRKNGF